MVMQMRIRPNRRTLAESEREFRARCYRLSLMYEIQVRTREGDGREPSSLSLQLGRARGLYEDRSDSAPPEDWDIKRIVDALVALAYPEDMSKEKS
jgi:hypothetical protein